jgi:acetyl esterase/lipase
MHDPELDLLLDALRGNGPDLSASPEDLRAGYDEFTASLPVAADIVAEVAELGGVPGLRLTAPGAASNRAVLYLHGGAYVVGSASGYRALAGELSRASGAAVYAVDYRLAPEHVFPAAVEDGVSAYRALLDRGIDPGQLAIAGDSAGGGLTIATLVAARDQGLPMPAVAVVISPWVDLASTGGTIESKAAEDPTLDGPGLRLMAAHYLAGQSPATPLASPVHADLTGLPPLLIQVGSAEILLDDAVRLAGVAGAAGVRTRLDIWSRMVHVWHVYGAGLTAGRRAIEEAGAFILAEFRATP